MTLFLFMLIIGGVLVLWGCTEVPEDDPDGELWWYVEDEIDEERGFRR